MEQFNVRIWSRNCVRILQAVTHPPPTRPINQGTAPFQGPAPPPGMNLMQVTSRQVGALNRISRLHQSSQRNIRQPQISFSIRDVGIRNKQTRRMPLQERSSQRVGCSVYIAKPTAAFSSRHQMVESGQLHAPAAYTHPTGRRRAEKSAPFRKMVRVSQNAPTAIPGSSHTKTRL